MSITRNEAEVILRINDEQGRKRLDELQQKAAALREKFTQAFKDGDHRGVNKINSELNKTNREIERLRTNSANVAAALKDIDKQTPRDLQRTLKAINTELNSGRVPRGSKEWDEYVTKLKEVKMQLKQVKEEMDIDDESFFDKIKNGINDWGASFAAATAAAAGVVMSGKAAVQAYADMQAEEANVMKYTGMTEEQVKQLNDEFKKMDTRTGRAELNMLAQDAGRLGKSSVADVLGFVKAADQINVALDDLGNEATLTLSKLTGIFGDEARYGTEQSLLKVGSIINELSQNCSASAPYIAEFASRIGGIAAQSNMAVSETMAYAAVLDSQNLALEASSTALGQLITKIYQDPAKIAKAAGLDVKKFAQTVKTDMNGALIMLFEQLNKFGGMENLATVFDEMGTDGARAIPVLAALSGHVEELKSQMDAAAEAFKEGTSVTKEFDVQNNTVQAGLDKARKGFDEMAVALGEQLVPVMSHCISGTSMMMRVMSTLVKFITEHKRAIVALGVAYITYQATVKYAMLMDKAHLAIALAKNAATKAGAALMGALKLATAAFGVAATAARNAVTYLNNGLEVNYTMTERSRAAMIKFNNAVKSNPLGLLLSVIAAVVVALEGFINKETAATKVQEALNNAIGEATIRKNEEEMAIEKYIGTLSKFNGTKEQEKELIDELNNRYGNIFGTYETLDQWLYTLTERGKDYCDNLYEQIMVEAKLEAARQLLAEAAKKRVEGETDQSFKDLSWIQEALVIDFTYRKALWNAITFKGGGFSKAFDENVEMFSDYNKNKANEEADELEAMAEKLMGEYKNESEQIEVRRQALQKIPEVITDAYETNEKYAQAVNEASQEYFKAAAEAKRNNDKTAEAAARNMFRDAMTALNAEVTRTESDGSGVPTVSGSDNKSGKGNTESDETKARKALKDDLDYQKYLRDKAEAENIARYSQGVINYREYLDEKKRIEEDYINAVVKTHEDHNKIDIAAYGSALKQRMTLKQKAVENERALSLKQLERERAESDNEATSAYFDPTSAVYKNETALSQALLDNQVKFLEAKAKLYAEESDQRKAAELELEKVLAKDKLDKQKELAEKYEHFVQEYQTGSDKRRMTLELQTLDELHKKGLISEEQYQTAVRKVKRKFREEDAKERMTVESEYTDMLNNLINSFTDLFSDLGKEGADFWANLSNAATAAFAVMSAGLTQFSAYSNAERDYELAKTEARYDKEIEAAGKNEKRKAKIEAKKEADVAAIKTKYNRRAMQIEIAQAVASTALAAINAYASGSKINVFLGPVAAALATAAGMAQIATIAKQHQTEAIGYYSGGFTGTSLDNRKEAGVVHANEFVANHKAVANPQLLPVLELIDHAQRTNTVGSLTREDVAAVLGKGSGVSARGGNLTAQADNKSVTAAVVTLAAVSDRLSSTIDRLDKQLNDGIAAEVVLDGENGLHKKYTRYKKQISDPLR